MILKKHPTIFIAFVVLVFIIWLLAFIPGDASFWLEFWWMFPVALLISLTVNTLGISGAALFVPFFILIFPLLAEPLSVTQSVKIGLITESFGLTSSAIAFLVFGLVDKKLAVYSALGAMPFVIIGTLVTVLIPQAVLYLLIAILLLLSVSLVYYRRIIAARLHDEHETSDIDYTVDTGESVKITTKDKKVYRYCRTQNGYKKRFLGYGVGGLFQGAAGFGIGEMGIISMILSHIPTRIAIGTSHLVVASTAVVAALMHILLSEATVEAIPWNIVLMNIPAVVIGGQIAPHLATKLKPEVLEKALIMLFSVIAFSLILLAFGSIHS